MCSYESYSHGTMRVRAGALTSISNANSLNVKAPTPCSHSIVRITARVRVGLSHPYPMPTA